MCPISGLVQFLIVVLTLLLICHGVFSQFQNWNISQYTLSGPIHMYDCANVNFTLTGPDKDVTDKTYLSITSEDSSIASTDKKIYLKKENFDGTFNGNFSIYGNFLGQTNVVLKVVNELEEESPKHKDTLKVVVIREERVIDKVFTASVATLVSIIYINFGCALKWGELYSNLKRPVGPAIGFFGQFIIMPLLSYTLAICLFPDYPEMQLGIFFTGVSPGGGASNIWTVILEGNMNLSITMTAISTLSAFAMMPLWIFTLGRIIFDKGDLKVPYSQISTYAVALIIPLAIGFLIQKKFQKVAQFLTRILKGFSSLLILFIIIFAIATNLYLFELFSWKIVIAGLGLPWLGYILAFTLAKIFRQSSPDCLTIAIETGIQNTGIAIFLLRFTLPQPQADLTTVAPVMVAIMTPFPLLFLYIYKLLSRRISESRKLIKNNNSIREFEGIDEEPKQKMVPAIA